MYTLIALFYLAMIGIVTMILLKRREFSTGKKSIISRIGTGSDRLFNQIFMTVKQGVSYVNRKSFIVITQWVAFHILLRTRKVYVEIKHQALLNPHAKKVIDAVRGRGQIQNHGASFYLRRISSNEAK